MDYFNRVPSEIKLNILSRVPTESVLDCKSVCKSWYTLVSHDPSFRRMHLHRLNQVNSGKLGFLVLTKMGSVYYFDYNDENHESVSPIERIRRVNLNLDFNGSKGFTSIIGSCNGLLCLVRCRSICICNPVTREQIMLPQIMLPEIKTQHYDLNCSFGYVSSSEEYKVVAVHTLRNKFVQLYVYTIGSGHGWRNLGEFDADFGMYSWLQGVFASGALYWIGSDLKMIYNFNLAEEKFEHLSPPPSLPDGRWGYNRIGVLNGFLYVAVWVNVKGEGWFDIWLLEKKKDIKEREHQSWVWTKNCRLKQILLAAVTKSGVLSHLRNNLIIYNPKDSTSKELVDFKEWIHLIVPHKNTIVSLQDLGEEDIEIMKSIEIEKTESHVYPLEHPEVVEA